MTQRASEKVAIVGVIDPDAYAASTVTTDYVDMSKWHQLMFIGLAGDIVSTGTIDAQVYAADDSSGTNPVAVTGKAITQLTQAGTDSNKQVIINVREDEVKAQATTALKRYVACSFVLGTAGADFGAIVLGLFPSHGVASDNDKSTVDEIID